MASAYQVPVLLLTAVVRVPMRILHAFAMHGMDAWYGHSIQHRRTKVGELLAIIRGALPETQAAAPPLWCVVLQRKTLSQRPSTMLCRG